MRRIIAIGGGEIGRPGYPVETKTIDKEIIRLSEKQKPNLLFIPTASSDSEGYYEVVKKHFGLRLGCNVDVLYLLKEKMSQKAIQEKVFSSDIIYVGGGNTLKMLNAWRKSSLDKILKIACEKGIILSGVSAGAIAWFKYGNSDSRKFANSAAGLIRVKALGFINALLCPHYNIEKDRPADLRRMMKRTSGIALALDNCCAIEIIGDNYRILKSKKDAKAYRVYYKKGILHEEIIPISKKLKPLNDLILK